MADASRCRREGSNIDSARELETLSADATESLAEQLGAACRGGELLLLSGELGAGKTCFVRGLARGLGADPRAVRSPSFTLMQSYAARRNVTLHHYDVYFTSALADLERAGLFESLAAGDVAAIEWGDRFAATLPPDRLEITLRHRGVERRQIRLFASGPRATALLTTLFPGPPRESGRPETAR